MVSHLLRRWSSVTRLTRWLPHVPLLHLDAWHTDDTATQLTVRVTSTPALVHGPICRFPTRRVHRRDVRTVMELPWGPWRVVPHLQVRKFFCANGRCTRRLLTERLAPLVAPWARRTQRLAPWLVHIAMARAGTAGACRSRRLGLGVSRHTLLRLRRRLPLPDVATPQVLGVDDWAVRNGRPDGTIVLASIPCFAPSGRRPCPRVSAVRTAAAVASRPTPPISSSAGTRVVVMRCGSSGRSNHRATPAVMPRSPATPSVCARRRGRHLGRGDAATPCRS